MQIDQVLHIHHYPMYRKDFLNPIKYSARYYLTTSTSKSKPYHGTPLESDNLWPSSRNPTPYDILGIGKGQQYQKTRYYNLVKAYHPDLQTSTRLPKEIQTHRFRLVVAAHAILSDTKKRAAYDMYGAGWSSPSIRDRVIHRYQSPFEREHDDDAHQRGFDMWQFISTHRPLLRLLVVVFAFGETCLFLVTLSKAEVELNRIDSQCRDLICHRQSRSLGASTLLQLERFLLRRDPSGLGLLPEEMESYRAVLPLCMY